MSDHGHVINRTLGEEIDRAAAARSPSNRYTNIRKSCVRIVKDWEKKCHSCGYDKHVETCHRKPISSYPRCALISEINDPNNLMLLCPNCHWEYDNGSLVVPDSGASVIKPL